MEVMSHGVSVRCISCSVYNSLRALSRGSHRNGVTVATATRRALDIQLSTLLDCINRSGLFKPTEYTFMTVVNCWRVYQEIKVTPDLYIKLSTCLYHSKLKTHLFHQSFPPKSVSRTQCCHFFVSFDLHASGLPFHIHFRRIILIHFIYLLYGLPK